MVYYKHVFKGIINKDFNDFLAYEFYFHTKNRAFYPKDRRVIHRLCVCVFL